MIDALPDAVLVVQQGVIVEANAAGVAAFASGRALVGRALGDLLSETERGRIETADAQRATGWPVPSTCRLRFTRLDGTPMMADVQWRHLPDGRVLLTARDVTDATRAEALMSKLAHLPTGLDGAEDLLAASEPIFLELRWIVAFTEIVDGGSVTLRVIAAPGDPVGDYGRTLVGRTAPLAETPIVEELLRTQQALYLDNLPTMQKGPVGRAVALSDSMDRARVARSAWCPILVAGRVKYVLAVTGADITEHDFVAIQLFSASLGAAIRIHALRLEMVHRERLAAVGEMSAVLAHEVRNPLGVMFTALATLARAEPGKTEDWRSLLAILQDEAERLQRLVTHLLEYANVFTPVMESVGLRPIVLDALHAAQHDASFAAASPQVRVSVADALLVRTDRELLRRMLLNVLLNAFQHVRPGGVVEVSALRASTEVALVVADEGAVISPEVASRAFEPFFTTKPSGTGLGLAIVRRMCTDVGARIAVAPCEGGTAFTLTLPRSDG
jgi:signal transduction histidine kinase